MILFICSNTKTENNQAAKTDENNLSVSVINFSAPICTRADFQKSNKTTHQKNMTVKPPFVSLKPQQNTNAVKT